MVRLSILIPLLCINIVLFCWTIVINYVHLFPNTVSEVSNKYRLIITPPNAFFSIWAVIYIYNCISLAYMTGYTYYVKSRPASSYKHNVDYHNQYLQLIVLALVNNIIFYVLNTLWNYTWCNLYIIPSTIIIIIMLLCNIAFLLYSRYYITKHDQVDLTTRHSLPYQILVYNQFSFLTGWLVCATALSVSINCVYSSGGEYYDTLTVIGQYNELLVSIVCITFLLLVFCTYYIVNIATNMYILNIAWLLSSIWGFIGIITSIIDKYELMFEPNNVIYIAFPVLLGTALTINTNHFFLAIVHNVVHDSCL